MRKLFAGMLLFILLTVLITTALIETTSNILGFPWLLLDILTLSAVSYIDHVQSVVLGSLVGILVPIYTRAGINTGFEAAGIFLTLQAIPFLVAFFIVILTPDSDPIILGLLIFYLTREGFIIGLSRILVYALNADLTEIVS